MRKINLPRAAFSGIEVDTIIEDIKDYIKNSKDYKEVWSDWVEGDTGSLIIRLVSFIADQIAMRIDWSINEIPLSTATQVKSILNSLNLLNYRPPLSKGSEVTVRALITKLPDNFESTQFEFPKFFKLNAISSSGKQVVFELLTFNDDGTINYQDLESGYIIRWEYLTGRVVYLNENTSLNDALYLKFYSGTTKNQLITLEGIQNERVKINADNIIEGSVQAFKITRDNNGEIQKREKMIQVESLNLPEAQDPFSGLLPYKIEIDENRSVYLKFANRNLFGYLENLNVFFSEGDISRLIQKLPEKDDEIEIWYRTGGGSATNISGKIINIANQKVEGYDPSDPAEISYELEFSFINNSAASGGAEPQSWEEAKEFAPLITSTVKKAVTISDYDYLLNNETYTLKSKSYGQQNKPILVRELYGVNIQPMETWHYIIPNKEGWMEKKPSEYASFFEFTSEEQFYSNKPFKWEVGEHNVICYLAKDPDTNPATRSQQGVLIINFSSMQYYNIFATAYHSDSLVFEITSTHITDSMFEKVDLPKRIEFIEKTEANRIKIRDSLPFFVDENNKRIIFFIDNDNETAIINQKAVLHYKIETFFHYLSRPIGADALAFNTKRIYPFYPNQIEDIVEPLIKITDQPTGKRSLFIIDVDYDNRIYDPKFRFERVPWNTEEKLIKFKDDTRGVGEFWSDYYTLANPKWIFNEELQKNIVDEYEYKIMKNITKMKPPLHTANDTSEVGISPYTEVCYQSILENDEIRFFEDEQLYAFQYRFSKGTPPSDTSPETEWRAFFFESPKDSSDVLYNIDELIRYLENEFFNTNRNQTALYRCENDIEFKKVLNDDGQYELSIRSKNIEIDDYYYFELKHGDGLEDPADEYTTFTKDLLYAIGFTEDYHQTNSKLSVYPIDNETGEITTENEFDKYDDFHTFYAHFQVDRRSEITTLDSKIFRDILSTKRLNGLYDVFKQPLIKTFDIKGKVYYNRVFSPKAVFDNINKLLKDRYNINRMEFGESVKKGEILSLIQGVEGVKYIEISYIGENLENHYWDENYENAPDKLNAYFDEIWILHENVEAYAGSQYGNYLKGCALQMIKVEENI